jgi:hypothetical protein
MTDKSSRLEIEAVVTRGMGYKTADLKRKDALIGVITLTATSVWSSVWP